MFVPDQLMLFATSNTLYTTLSESCRHLSWEKKHVTDVFNNQDKTGWQVETDKQVLSPYS